MMSSQLQRQVCVSVCVFIRWLQACRQLVCLFPGKHVHSILQDDGENAVSPGHQVSWKLSYRVLTESCTESTT